MICTLESSDPLPESGDNPVPETGSDPLPESCDDPVHGCWQPAGPYTDSYSTNLGEIHNATHFMRDKIISKDGTEELVILTFSEKGEDNIVTQKKYVCEMKKDETCGIIYDEIEDEKVPLRLTFEEGKVVEVEKIVVGESQTIEYIHIESSLHNQVPSQEYFRLGLTHMIGRPEAPKFKRDDTGKLMIEVETLIDKLNGIRRKNRSLAQEISKIQNTQSNHTTTLSSIDTSVANTVNNAVKATLSTFSQSFFNEQHERLNSLEESISANIDHHTKNVNDHTSGSEKMIHDHISASESRMLERIKKHVNEMEQANESRKTKMLEHVTSEAASTKTDINKHIDEELNSILFTKQGALYSQINGSLKALNKHLKNYSLNMTSHITNKVLVQTINTLSQMMGVTVTQGAIESESPFKVETGSLLVQINKQIHDSYERAGISGEAAQSNDLIKQILEFGGLPIFHRDNIEAMLYRHTCGIQTPIVKSIEEYVSEFDRLSNNDQCKYFSPQLREVSDNIKVIIDFFKSSDELSINRFINNFIKLFGDKFKAYDTHPYELSNYCKEAHFSKEDSGLYGWVKDIHESLESASKELSQRNRKNSVGKAAQHFIKVRDLLKGVVPDGSGKIVAIPRLMFGEYQNYPQILEKYAEMIKDFETNSRAARMERTINELFKCVQNFVVSANKTIHRMSEEVRAFVQIPIEVRHVPLQNPKPKVRQERPLTDDLYESPFHSKPRPRKAQKPRKNRNEANTVDSGDATVDSGDAAVDPPSATDAQSLADAPEETNIPEETGAQTPEEADIPEETGAPEETDAQTPEDG
ncbi:MAG: hypothetical protein LBQ43_05070 [Holosporales bacterium]|nr:hypothetical protein [Holosporales bacterium]